MGRMREAEKSRKRSRKKEDRMVGGRGGEKRKKETKK